MKRLPTVIKQAHQQGVASLIVVMVLFFVVSLVAAYASRNLIFEQRTSANQYRSTQAIEAAEAGLDWATALLNHGRIGSSCETSASLADTSFRTRYLNVDPSTGYITAKTTSSGGDLTPTCVFDGSSWTCECQAAGPPALTGPTSGGVFPAYRVRFVRAPTFGSQPGIVRIDSVGCTRLDDECLTFNVGGLALGSEGLANEGRAYASTVVALSGGMAAVPRAALTALGTVNLGAGARFFNGDVPIHAGGAINPNPLPTGMAQLAAGSAGGTLPPQTDAAIAALAGAPDRMFAAVFSMWSTTFRSQPGAVEMDCGAVTCDADTLRDTVAMNPGRPIWVNGSLDIDNDVDIGSATAPAVVVVTGSVNVSTPDATIYGLLYVQTANWADTGALQVSGAVVVEGNVVAGSPMLNYDAALLNLLRWTSGSFVRVPGSWRDFPEN